jgi:hypothetical protein
MISERRHCATTGRLLLQMLRKRSFFEVPHDGQELKAAVHSVVYGRIRPGSIILFVDQRMTG